MKHFTTLSQWAVGVLLITSLPAKADEKDEVAKTFTQRESSILMPMIQYDRDKIGKGRKRRYKYTHHDVLAKIIVNVDGNHRKFELEINPKERSSDDIVEIVEGRLRTALKLTYGYTGGADIEIKTNKFYSTQNSTSFSGPIAVSLGASLVGKSTLPGLTVCADMVSANDFDRPEIFWRQLKGLRRSSKPHRVLVAAETEEDFIQLVALEELNFFILNELVIVHNLKDAVKASYTGGNQKLLAASKVFAQIQAVAEKKSINSIVSHPQMKAKLSEVLRLCPDHLSAKLLLLAGEGKGVRPDGLSQKYAAHELQTYLDLVKQQVDDEESYDYSDGRRKNKAERLAIVAKQMEDDLTKLRTFLVGDMKDNCEVLRKEIPDAMNSWARSLRQPEAAYHIKNSAGQKITIERHVKSIERKLKLAITGNVKADPNKEADSSSEDPGFDDSDNQHQSRRVFKMNTLLENIFYNTAFYKLSSGLFTFPDIAFRTCV